MREASSQTSSLVILGPEVQLSVQHEVVEAEAGAPHNLQQTPRAIQHAGQLPEDVRPRPPRAQQPSVIQADRKRF
jgi:hypothetical protein